MRVSDNIKREDVMKELELYFTPGIQEVLPDVNILKLSQIIRNLFKQYCVDMFIFENKDKCQAQIRLAGYSFETDNFDDTAVVYRFDFDLPETF